jgi:myo-inositol catabolism protein IolC
MAHHLNPKHRSKTMTTTVPFDLTSLMREHKVTIKQLADRTGLTMKRIRAIRSLDRVTYTTYCDLTQTVTGVNVFNCARYDAIRMQGNPYRSAFLGR